MSVTVSLPNGMMVSCLQKHDVPIVQLEIESYFAKGLQLRPGDTVFDVGANIGLFSLAAYDRCAHNLHVFAFEPVKAIYNVLRANLERCASRAQVKAFDVGLANHCDTVPFAYYPRAPVLSTAYPDEEEDLRMVKDAVLNSIIYLDQAPLAVRCLRWIPEAVRAAILDYALRRTLRPQTVTCQMRTL